MSGLPNFWPSRPAAAAKHTVATEMQASLACRKNASSPARVAAVAAGCGPLIRIVASQALARLWLSTVAQHCGEPRIGTAQISLKLAAVFDVLVSHNI